MPPRVKICGLTRSQDALAAERAGADYLGVVLSEGFGRSVPPERAADILAGSGATNVAVLVDEHPADAVRLATAIRAGVIQLHGAEGRPTVEALRGAGEWRLWKAVRARTPDDISAALDEVGDLVDGFLVEGWRDGVIGGGGVSLELDPEVVRALLPDSALMILAGGLEPRTVRETMARYRPDVVDVSSGVEKSPGIKDHELLESFIQSVRM